MDVILYVLLLALGLIASFLSGLLGIGGAIINYPLLLYVPPMIGAAEFTAQEVSSISMFQVFFGSLAGVIAYRNSQKKTGNSLIHQGLVIYMGSSILIGSFIGGLSSQYLSSYTIHIIYGILAVIAVLLMLIPNRGKKEEISVEVHFHKTVAICSAFTVGIVSGIVGAGGAFILIPLMLNVMKIPIRVTIASSLAIVFISAIGGVIGKLTGGHLLIIPTLFVIIGSLVGAPLGSQISTKMNAKVLRYILVVLITATAVKIWSSVFS